MTDQTKFEEMLEKLVNEDRDGAEALFHEIVVEKSREIYQNILDEADEEVDETTDEEVDEATDEEVDESDDEDLDESDDDLDEMFGLDEPEMEADPAMDMMKDIEGGDEEGGDMDMDDEGDDEEGAEGPEEAMADLEDALEALKAEFEKMMGDEEPGDEDPEEEAMAFEADEEVEEAADEEVDEATDEEVDEAADEEVEESKAPKTASEEMREYVEKITPKMGDNGANTKSIVAGANDMGGTASNIAQSGADEKGGTGASAPKEDNAGNVNTPGGKASKSMKSQPGHGAEKKGKPESADKGAGSPLNGAPKRAK